MSSWKIIILFLIFVAANILIFNYIAIPVEFERDISYGATFSKPYAEEFGLDWRKAYLAVLDDLKVRKLRIPAYWDLIEPEQDKYDFTDLDWQINEADKRDAKIILAIGRKLPRWPECFMPDWVKGWNETAQQERVFKMLKDVVLRYKDRDVISAWQVENEPFFKHFGECPPADEDFLAKEIEIVKSLDDSRPIIITESGELSTWMHGAKYGDTVGVSMYWIVWNKYWGYFHHHFPAFYYNFKTWLVGKVYDTPVIVSEMQAEPWGAMPAPALSLEEQLESMNLKEFERSLIYLRKTSFDEAYLWGVEWWYWLKETQGVDDFWERGKELFQ
ncbi:MAG: beta-galactosidase [Parcubacteria group bacterium]|nr:beta-galactosidase [Parcubacteria group bacterium]